MQKQDNNLNICPCCDGLSVLNSTFNRYHVSCHDRADVCGFTGPQVNERDVAISAWNAIAYSGPKIRRKKVAKNE